ncbi:hypothetical protein Csa_020043 [Cucumis sativus]|nr:hypothetical protein Csa_020043 [Cucumis sativus]
MVDYSFCTIDDKSFQHSRSNLKERLKIAAIGLPVDIFSKKRKNSRRTSYCHSPTPTPTPKAESLHFD